MSDLWVEASRDLEAETAEVALTEAKMVTAGLWPFLALSQSEREFEHRLALAQPEIDDAVSSPDMRDRIVASFREDYGLVHESSRPAEEPLRVFHEASGQWITAAADPTPANPGYPDPTPEAGPATGVETYNFAEHPTGGDPWNPINGEMGVPPSNVVVPVNQFPAQPQPWTTPPDKQWVEHPMVMQPGGNAYTGAKPASERARDLDRKVKDKLTVSQYAEVLKGEKDHGLTVGEYGAVHAANPDLVQHYREKAAKQPKTSAKTAAANLHAMENGDEVVVDGHHVRYEAEQAMGDDGQPARGYTTGTYRVTDPKGNLKVFRHTPYKPGGWADRAKPYAAEQAMDHIFKRSAKQAADSSGNRYVNEGVETGPGPNPDYFAEGGEGVGGDQQAGFPADVALPEPDERVDMYGAVPPQQSSGTGPGQTQGYSNTRQGFSVKTDPVAEAQRTHMSTAVCTACGKTASNESGAWHHSDGTIDHMVELPGNHPWVRHQLRRGSVSKEAADFSRGDKVTLTEHGFDEESDVKVPKGFHATVDHVTKPEDDDNGDVWVGIKHKQSPDGIVYISPSKLKHKESMHKGAPFAGYKDFADCVSKNQDKHDPEAYCGSIKHKVEDSKTGKAQFYDPEDSRVAMLRQGEISSTDMGPGTHSPGAGDGPMPDQPPSMIPGGPGAVAMPPLQPGGQTPGQPPTQQPGPMTAAKVAEQVRERPTEFNPSGVADEYQDVTWEGATQQRPMQSAEHRRVNTPQQPMQPIPQVSSEGPGEAEEEEEERRR